MPTNIFLRNNALQMVNPITVAGGQLTISDYHTRGKPVNNGAYVAVLNVNRNLDIKDGEEFAFFTVFTAGALNFTIITELTGTATNSFMVNTVRIFNGTKTFLTQPLSDTGQVSVEVPTGQTLVTVTVNRYWGGIFDDVDVTISANNAIPPGEGANSNYQLPSFTHNGYYGIPLLDVWGEGRIVTDENEISGFPMAYNLNKTTQLISNGPNEGKKIPNLLGVTDYNNPVFPLWDNSVLYMTLMGAPITAGTVREMVRTLNNQIGVVFLYDPNPGDVRTFEANMDALEFKEQDPINTPFDEPTFTPVRVYGYSTAQDHDEL